MPTSDIQTNKVAFCSKCVMSNQKPNTSIEYKNTSTDRSRINLNEGVCAACEFAAKKNDVNWDKREELLLELLDKYRRNDGHYDVIVPASGGKDSYYTAHILKHKYGMHPLTVTWAPHLYTDVGWHNLQAMTHIGELENILFTPNGKVHRKITQLAFKNLLHPFQPFVFGQKNIGPTSSINFGVPLVMYGESNLEYGDPTDSDDDVMSEEYFAQKVDLKEIMLGGISAQDLISDHGFTLNDLNPYLPVDPDGLRNANTAVHYLGHYLKWDPQECYYYAVEHGGFKAADDRSEGTYSKYSEIDDKMIPLHFYCMHIKFGIGRAMYDAAQEIRNDKIMRDEGIALVNKYDGEYPTRWLSELLEYLELTQQEFDQIIDTFRPNHLWQKSGEQWKLRLEVN